MEYSHARDEQGIHVPAPFARTVKVLFAPDRHDVPELTFSFAILDPGGATDYHVHDRPELILVVSGVGEARIDGTITALEPDTVLYVRTGEWHEIRNLGQDVLKLATVFVPGYRADDNYRRCLDAAAAAQPAAASGAGA